MGHSRGYRSGTRYMFKRQFVSGRGGGTCARAHAAHARGARVRRTRAAHARGAALCPAWPRPLRATPPAGAAADPGHRLPASLRALQGEKGRLPMTPYLRPVKMGDYVDIVANSSIHKGMPHK
jgi:ribosomal protein L21E